MSWRENHRKSSVLAYEASMAAHKGNAAQSQTLYREAADAEAEALKYVGQDKPRTYTATAVNVVSLYIKADDRETASALAQAYLDSGRMTDSGARKLATIISESSINQA